MDKTTIIIIAAILVIILVIAPVIVRKKMSRRGSIFLNQKNRYKDRTRAKKNMDGTVKRRGFRKKRK